MIRERGFTVIELISVLVILGVLIAVAVPRYVNLRDAAIIAAMDNLTRAINSASNVAHTKAIIEGLTREAAATLNVNNVTIDLVYGYPAGTVNGIGQLVLSDDWQERASVINGAWVYWHNIINEDAGAAGCYVRYRQSAGIGNQPVIELEQGGCPTAE